jgi:hypothetical protein
VAAAGDSFFTVGVVMISALVGGVMLCVGPAGIKTQMSGWSASAYGSDWLVVQYAQSGCVIASWELENEAIQNEGSSDGIYFVTEEGPVVHLSGHYTYAQDPNAITRIDLLAERCDVLD